MQEYQVKAVIQESVNNTLEKDKISACLADVIKEVEREKNHRTKGEIGSNWRIMDVA